MTDRSLMTIAEVTKSYESSGFQLGPLSIEFFRGEALALLGKNGAGKTTLFQLITGNIDATSGEIRFLGKKLMPDKYELKRQLGYLPQHLELPRWVTGREILTYATRLYELDDPKRRIEEALAYWDAAAYAAKPLAACSHGMKKRVALALATLHDPEFLILDEPFSGLDLYHTRALEETIARRRATGKATIVCTHIVPYAARYCERAFVMDSGRLEAVPEWADLSYETRVERMEAQFFAAPSPAQTVDARR